MLRRGLSCLLFLALLTGPPAGAQTNTGEIGGVVRDASGAVLPGGVVVATHPASGTTVERVTDKAGRFFLPALRIGEWDLTVSLPGFAVQTRKGIVLEIGRTVTLDFTLGIQGLQEQVIVQSTIPLLQATTAEISDVIENREVVQIPLNGRNFLALAQLSDAVVIPPGGTRGDALQQAGPLPNVGGQRSGHNIYLLDGAKITDELFNNLVINPSVDSIQEFRIQKSMYPAEFGGKASALINVATRAGSNAFTGSLFEFHRNEAFDSANYFHPKGEPIPELRQNQFGGALGGPPVRDRSFFFGSYEGHRMRRALTRTFSVPTPAVRSGDFSGFAAVCDPLTVPSTGVCAPFPGNRIPADRIDPIAAALLARVPMPMSASAVQNLTAVEEQDREVDQVSFRLDHRLGDASQVFGRFSTFDADELQPFGAGALQEALVPGFGRSLATRTRNMAVSHTHVFGTSLLNELRFGWMSVAGGQASVNRGVDFAGDVGLLGVTRDPRDTGFPQVSFRGLYSTIGDPTSFVYRDNQHFELYDNVTLDRGAHRFKFGAYYFYLRLRPEQPDNARGALTYTGQFTGNAFADFLLGYPTSAASGIGRGDENGRTNWLHLYAQDDWQARRNLTFNLGLRYEFNQHMYDVDDRLSSIDLSVPGGRFVIAGDRVRPSGQPLLPFMPIPYVTSEEIGWGRGLLDPSAVRLAPRVGFALTLDDSRAVIRGGYGIFLNQWAYSVQTAFARNLPFFYTKQVDVPSDVRVPTLRTRDILAGDATGTVGASIMDYGYNVEYSQTWSGGLQYELLSATMAEVAYMGTWTIGADNATVRNVPEPGPGSIQARRPIPQMSRINAIRFDGKSMYHGVTFKLERRLRDGYAYNVSYTLSTSKDDASSPGPTESEANVPQNVRNIFDETGEWAHSSFDHRHLFVASGAYEIPFVPAAPRWVASVLGGWRVNTVIVAQSGAPFTVNLGVDQANIGAGPAQRPNQLRDPNLPRGQRSPDRWFDTDAFALPASFTFGSAPRNSVLGPGFANVDLALAKTWNAGRSAVLELRWEVFNLLNRANFDLPNRIFGTPNFDRIFSAKSPREMQFGVRLSF
ncbi:MAG: carboxypeptidase regulatory-like domain-containing protein [Acidobacteria bacterium]|nr:carboxypeptidase regulatory-like domain-containing protein [Acidobacteriota bacterium]